MKKSPEYDGPHNLTNRMDPTLKFLGRGSKFRVPGQFSPAGATLFCRGCVKIALPSWSLWGRIWDYLGPFSGQLGFT